MISYTLRFHVGTPTKSTVVHSVEYKAQGDMEANEIRCKLERKVEFKYDFNLVCQTEYLEKQNLL